MFHFGVLRIKQERNFQRVSAALPLKKGSVIIACSTYVLISQSTVEVRKDIALLRYRNCFPVCFLSLLT